MNGPSAEPLCTSKVTSRERRHRVRAWIRILAQGVALTCVLARCERSTAMHGEFAAISPEIVTTFDYETPNVRVSAHRFGQKDRFLVSTQIRGEDGIRYCQSDDHFQKLLGEFESLRIRRSFTERELAAVKKGRIAYHRLRLVAAPPLEASEQILMAQPNGHLLVEMEDLGYELNLTTGVVEQIAQSCRVGSR